MAIVVPCLLMVLLKGIFGPSPGGDRAGPQMFGIFPFTYLIASVAMLRARSLGITERLRALPARHLDLVCGHLAALAAVQVVLVTVVSVGPLGLPVAGPVPSFLAATVLTALLDAALGLAVSAYTRTEFQAV